jgi:transposase
MLAMLGIDVSSLTLHGALWLRDAPGPAWLKQVPNTPIGVDDLLSLTPPGVPLVVEPTGRYSHLVVQRAQEAGRTVLMAPPLESKLFRASLQVRAKTDKLDGRGLALFGHSRPLPPYTLKSETVDQVDQLLSARKGLARSLASLRLQAQSLPKAREALAPSIEHLASQIKGLDKQIAALTAGPEAPKEFAAASKLRQVTGIGPVTAAAVTSRLASKQFGHPDQFVAYIGLDVAVRQSGKREGEKGLTKHGDAELRRLLFVCAKATLRALDNPFKAQYERERHKGLSSTAALCAVARKMACVCWALHHYNTDYDPQRVGTRPEKPKGQDEHQKTDAKQATT